VLERVRLREGGRERERKIDFSVFGQSATLFSLLSRKSNLVEVKINRSKVFIQKFSTGSSTKKMNEEEIERLTPNEKKG
jgi:hypothetical protein